MQDLKVCLIQCSIYWENIGKNLDEFGKRLDSVTNKPDIIIFPEMFTTGFSMNTEVAELMNGQAVSWMKNKSAVSRCIIAGSLFICEDGKYFNRFVWMYPDGRIETYDKRHLFKMGNEHEIMSCGARKKIVEYQGWKINLQICYDLRFPVWSKNRFKNESYDFDVLVYIANWPEIRNHAYKTLTIARAIENQSYVIWVNRVGKDKNGINHSGDSMVIDPAGKILAAAPPGQDEILHCVLNREYLDDLRKKFTVGLDWDDFRMVN
jgi:predicted amidohydrolase